MKLGSLPRILRAADFRLPFIYASLFAVSAAILGTAFYWTVQSSLERQMTARIEAEIATLKEALRSEGASELIEEVERRNRVLAFEYLLLDPRGNRVVGNLPDVKALGWGNVRSNSGLAGGQQARTFRILTVPLDNGMRLSVAEDLQFTEDLRHAWLEACGLGFLIFMLLSLLGGVLLSNRFLNRVDAIRTTAEAIVNGDLESRIPLRGTGDNFDLLAGILNKMLDRIGALMESMVHVSNDIAHALRSPLTRLRQKLEIARGAAEGNPTCERAIDAAQVETEQILETFSALLRIAQIEGGSRQSGFGEVDLTELFGRVADAFSDLAEDERKTLATRIEPTIHTWGDRELLTEMVANIVDNAIRHTPAGARIEVSLTRDDSEIIGSVCDDGLGVPRDEYGRIFQRFYRLERSTGVNGTGLGLSLVAAVARLHEISLAAEDSAPGLRISMRFKPTGQFRRSMTERSSGNFSNSSTETLMSPRG
jgi:signal transduction histidine kinase